MSACCISAPQLVHRALATKLRGICQLASLSDHRCCAAKEAQRDCGTRTLSTKQLEHSELTDADAITPMTTQRGAGRKRLTIAAALLWCACCIAQLTAALVELTLFRSAPLVLPSPLRLMRSTLALLGFVAVLCTVALASPHSPAPPPHAQGREVVVNALDTIKKTGMLEQPAYDFLRSISWVESQHGQCKRDVACSAFARALRLTHAALAADHCERNRC